MNYSPEFLGVMHNRSSREKWLVLVLAALTHMFVVAMPATAIPVLINEISFLFWAGMGLISILALPFLKGVWPSKKAMIEGEADDA